MKRKPTRRAAARRPVRQQQNQASSKPKYKLVQTKAGRELDREIKKGVEIHKQRQKSLSKKYYKWVRI